MLRSSKEEDKHDDSPCQQHDFLFGLVFYNRPSIEKSIELGLNPQLSNEFAVATLVRKLGLGTIGKMAYNASFAASTPGTFSSAAWRSRAYNFCMLPGVSCECFLGCFIAAKSAQFKFCLVLRVVIFVDWWLFLDDVSYL